MNNKVSLSVQEVHMLDSKKHLIETDQGYFQHLGFAVKWGLYLITTGVISIVHGIIPGVWKFKAPRNVMKIARMIERRGHPQELADDQPFEK